MGVYFSSSHNEAMVPSQVLESYLFLAFATAKDPPTPPPTVGAITTMARITSSQNVDG